MRPLLEEEFLAIATHIAVGTCWIFDGKPSASVIYSYLRGMYGLEQVEAKYVLQLLGY